MTTARTTARRPARGKSSSRRGPRRRPARPGTSPRGRGIAAWWPALLVLVAVVAAAVVWSDEEAPVPAPTGTCGPTGSALTVTTEQAANAATIAAVARVRGLPERAAVIALATAQQESRLRNLSYGDRDSLGLFQQRPSQGWGSEEQVQDPRYASGKFYDGLVKVPGWTDGRLTEVAQAVQRSGFPEAYQQWEPMATELAAALGSPQPAALTCRYGPADETVPGPPADAVAAAARADLGVPATTENAGHVLIDAAAGRPGAAWAVAHAERLRIGAVEASGWRWTPEQGWVRDLAAGWEGIVLGLPR